MDGDEIPVFDVDLDQDPLLRWKAIAAAPQLYLPTFMSFMSIMRSSLMMSNVSNHASMPSLFDNLVGRVMLYISSSCFTVLDVNHF